MKTTSVTIILGTILIVGLLVACGTIPIDSATPTQTVRADETMVPTKNPTPLWTTSVQDPVTEKPSQTSIPLPTRQKATPTILLTEPVISKKSVPDVLRKYLGMEFPPMPDTFSSGFGQLLSPDTAYPGYEFGIDIAKDGTNNLLLFSRLKNRDKQGKAHWTVVDILILPELEEGKRFLTDGCKIGKETKVDHEILAIIDFDKEVKTSRYVTNDKVLRAWRVNRSAEVIEEIPTDGIECFADSSMRYW